MKNIKQLNILNLIGFVVMVTINALANILPFAGRTTADISEFTDNLFVPAGFTFSIWGVIYLSLAVFIFYSFWYRKTPIVEQTISNIGYWFFISCLNQFHLDVCVALPPNRRRNDSDDWIVDLDVVNLFAVRKNGNQRLER